MTLSGRHGADRLGSRDRDRVWPYVVEGAGRAGACAAARFWHLGWSRGVATRAVVRRTWDGVVAWRVAGGISVVSLFLSLFLYLRLFLGPRIHDYGAACRRKTEARTYRGGVLVRACVTYPLGLPHSVGGAAEPLGLAPQSITGRATQVPCVGKWSSSRRRRR